MSCCCSSSSSTRSSISSCFFEKGSKVIPPRSIIQNREDWKFRWERTSRGGKMIEVAQLMKTNRVELKGSVDMGELRTGVDYEVVLMVNMKEGQPGWEHPATLTLSVPEQGEQRRQANLYENLTELQVGQFTAASSGRVSFGLLQDKPQDKKGLVLKGAVVRPA